MVLKLGAFLSVILALCYINFQKKSYFDFDFFRSEEKTVENKDVLFTNEELKQFNGVESNSMYLSILGNVFDVTAGKRHYGPGSDYNIFIGRDASKSFITGEFSNMDNELDDVLTLSHEDLLGLEDWKKMYQKQYIYKGKLIGRFYDDQGLQTEYMKKVKIKVEEGIQKKIEMEKLLSDFPPCNMEWDASSGTKVWCSKKSGGIERNWEGVPRLLYTVSASEPKCVCVKDIEESKSNPKVKEYKNCDPLATICLIPKTDIR